MFKKFLANNLFYIFAVIIFGLIVLWPSFKLHVTGDDYLGLWRFNWSLHESSKNYNYFTYWLTDYGPEDSMTAYIHHFVGFEPLTYYIISFIAKVLAAISLIPLVNLLTKNKKAALVSSLFFIITAGGLETTDWVFNMPSYFGIAFLNIFFYLLLKDMLQKKMSLKTFALFFLTIVTQPIRLTFLPAVVVVIQAFMFLSKRETLKVSLIRTSIFLVIFLSIFKFTEIGDTQLIPKGSYQPGTFWTTPFGVYLTGLRAPLEGRDYKFLLTPFANFTLLIVPDNIIPNKFKVVRSQDLLLIVSIATFFMYCISQVVIKKIFYRDSESLKLVFLFGLIWIGAVYLLISSKIGYPLQTSVFLAYLFGGPAVFSIIMLFIKINKFEFRLGIILSISVVLITILYLWIKAPLQVVTSYARYLIVPASGLSLLLGIIAGKAKKRTLLYFSLVILFLVHMYSTFEYLYKLSEVRATGFTEKIRSSVPDNPKFRDENEPLVYYFVTNNERVLYHSLMFGFPVIMAYKYEVRNPWRLAYTTSWQEVVSAYTDGKSMERFIGKIYRVKLDNIYGFKLTNHNLTDNTQEVRERLTSSQQKP